MSPDWQEDTNSKFSGSYVAYNVGTEPLLFPSVQQYISNYIDKLEEETSVTDGTYGEAIPLLLLPQALPEDACINVTYEVTDSSESDGFAEKERTINIRELVDAHNQPLTPSWEIGTRYTYRLVYTNEVAKKNRIYFAPTVGDWADGGIVVVHL